LRRTGFVSDVVLYAERNITIQGVRREDCRGGLIGMNDVEMAEKMKEIVKKSQELYEEMKSVLKQIDVDGMFIEMCNAISRWEEMDYYLVNIRDYYTERAFVKAGKILD